MEREISLTRDLRALWQLCRTLFKLRPTIVDASTPKAGLLTGIAALVTRVPCRVYTLRGLRLETAHGFKRSLLWIAERVACACSHRVICVSPSLRARAISLGLVSANKAIVLANGSGGVDLRRFSPSFRSSAETAALRHDLGIPEGVPVLGFVGRFVKDKGIRELIEAFHYLRRSYPELRLLLVGDFEDGDPVESEVRSYIESDSSIIRPGFVSNAAPYYALMDVLALPTHREGFPGVPLEAQASGVPVVTTTATGAIDSVIDGTTGILVPVGDAYALGSAIHKLISDPGLRSQMGAAGRARMEKDFRPEVIWEELSSTYRNLAIEKNQIQPATTSKANLTPIKRAFDLILASIALVLLSPILVVVAALVAIFLGSPIFFRQKRAGFLGVPFECLKFRTMTDARDENGNLLPDADRITALGRFLRSTSLDELPELINVIRGEMSLVGPRPLLERYLERYSEQQMRRHDVLPGITGWAQINGRNTSSWDDKFACDLWYVEHHNLWLDIKILFLTIWKIARRDGISQPGHATMPEFMGRMAKERRDTI